MRATLVLVAAVLTFGCATDDGPAAAGEEAGVDLSVPDGETEAVHDGGLTVRLADLETLPANYAADLPAGNELVKVTLELSNGGDGPVPLESPMRHMALLYGPNLEEASRATGYMTDDPARELDQLPPRQVGPGETVEVFYSFEAPDVTEMTVEATIEPDVYPPVRFSGAEALLD
jgi:hypothetical protein